MTPDQLFHLSGRLIVKFQTPQDLSRQFFADFRMPLEMIDPLCVCGLNLRLSKIMKQHGQAQDFVRLRLFQRMKGVLSHRINMMGIVLPACHADVKLRQHHPGNPAFPRFPKFLRVRGC